MTGKMEDGRMVQLRQRGSNSDPTLRVLQHIVLLRKRQELVRGDHTGDGLNFLDRDWDCDAFKGAWCGGKEDLGLGFLQWLELAPRVEQGL